MFKTYIKKGTTDMRPFIEGEVLSSIISISQPDRLNGSPKLGDMIAINSNNSEDQWLVAEQYFKDNYELK